MGAPSDEKRGVPTLPEIDIVKPKKWDLAALIVLGASGGLCGANLLAAQAETGAISGTLTTLFILAQLGLCCFAFLVMGKTAKMGTIWGNLLALGAGLSGMSGVLLASALWALA